MLNSKINIKFNNSEIQQKQNKIDEPKNPSAKTTENSVTLINYLSFTGNINKASLNFGISNKPYCGFSPNLSEKQIDEKLDNHSMSISFAPVDDYKNLKLGDQQALKHLLKAAFIFDSIALKQDNPMNIPISNSLQKKAQEGDQHAGKLLTIFNIFKGIDANDGLSPDKVQLFKGLETPIGKGFYPSDLKKEEFLCIINNMLDDNQDKEVARILSNRTIVKRDGDKLKAVDFTEEYKEDFDLAAKELEKAAKVTTSQDLKEFLELQADALKSEKPNADCQADIKWATLENQSPLEFTLIRENYEDEMTGVVLEDEKIKTRLEKKGISVNAKDSLGIRVGITDIEKTTQKVVYRSFFKELAELMPFNDRYVQKLPKQAFADVKLLCMTGESGAVRGGVVLAENLPNDEKESLKKGGGRRNVFHQQVMDAKQPSFEKIDMLLAPENINQISKEGFDRFIIGHEVTHALGPGDEYKSKLGNYCSTIEEMKADIGSLMFTDYLVKKGEITEDVQKQTISSMLLMSIPACKPAPQAAHRVMELMIMNHLFKDNAIELSKDQKLKINPEKVVESSKKIMKEVIEIQLSEDPQVAKNYIEKWSEWDNSPVKILAEKNAKLKPTTYVILDQSFAKKLASEV
ncbi:MAG: hypothetical protein WCK67_13390 [bacterium]